MEDFQNEVSTTTAKIKYLREITAKLDEEIKKKSSSVFSQEEEDLLHREIKEIEQMFREKTQDIKNDLRNIKTNNDQIKAQGFNSTSTFQYETRNSHWQALTNTFSNACLEFRNVQVKYRKLEEQKLISQYRIIYPALSIDEIKEKIRNNVDDGGFAGFGKGNSSTQDSYLRAKDRKERVEQIVESISQLCLLIDELHEMVKQSGRTIDKIEVKIVGSVETTAKAKRELQNALRYQISATKIKRIIWSIIAIIILIILIYLGIKIYKFKPTNSQE